MGIVLSGDEANLPQELTEAQVNHLRRLLAWLICEYNLSEAGQSGVLIGLNAAVATGVQIERAQTILDQEVERIRHVPAYIRHAVRMLSKAIMEHDAKTGVVNARTQSEEK